MQWRQFKNNYKRHGLVLVLGAGVSVGSGIPSWEGLIRGMVANEYPTDPRMYFRLKKRGLSLTAIASLLEERTPGGRKEFVENVRGALYQEFRMHSPVVAKSESRRFTRFVEEGIQAGYPGEKEVPPNHTLHSVGAFCTVCRPPQKRESPYFVNPLVHAVVTLNMDALLQTYVYARTKKHLVRTVDRPSTKHYPHRINIYHMHGYLHFDPQKDKSKDKADLAEQARDAPDAVVLTEQDYYDFFNNPNSLYNYTFLYLLREYSCLFVGVSMDDENIRRLLHYSKLERIRALEKKKGLTLEGIKEEPLRNQYQKELRAECARHVALLPHNLRLEVDKAQEDTLRPLGVTIRWVKRDFSDLPEQLGDLYSASGESWEEVYSGRKQPK